MLANNNITEKIDNIELFILDMDGTVYLGNKVFPFAPLFVEKAKTAGKKVVYFTNNSSRCGDVYYEKLQKMGFLVEREDIFTSGDVTAEYLLKNHKGEKVYLVGTPALEENFLNRGIVLGEDASIVVTAFDTTITYKKIETACRIIAKGGIFYSTHPDFNCPTEDGFIPDCGAINALITASTGKTPKYFGKPYVETARFLSEKFGVPFEKSAVVGDRLYTDIALGKANGLLSILVLTGETKAEDVNQENSPDIIMENIGAINNFIKTLDKF